MESKNNNFACGTGSGTSTGTYTGKLNYPDNSCYILPKPEHDLEKICTELLPKFVHLSPDEAAKAAINYAKALIKELDI